MKRYEVISVDMFQTLVDIDARIEIMWKRILGKNYNSNLKNEYNDLVYNGIIKNFYEVESKSSDFKTIKEIVYRSFEEIFRDKGKMYSAEKAVDIFLDEHNKAELFSDSLNFIKVASEKYKVCLVSDADAIMISSQIEKFDFHKIFISEEIKAYKNSPGNRLFRKMIEEYHISPEKVLHIGDATADVEGAKKAGMDACWLNRKKIPGNFSMEPDYILYSLGELSDILNI